MRSAFLLSIAVLAGMYTQATAQVTTQPVLEEDAEELVEPVRRYTVELIVFAYTENGSADNEIWQPEVLDVGEAQDAVRDRYSPAFSPVYPDPDGDLEEIELPSIARRYMDPDLVMFGEDDYTMTQTYDKLTELEAYEPLLRAGWTQPTYEKDVTGPIALQTLAESPPWLDGSVMLYLGRYLHLVVDVTMDEDRRVPEDPDDESIVEVRFEDARQQNQYEAIDVYGEVLPQPIRYRIFEDRIMKNGDVRYFDHPKFGVIAKITRYEEPEEDEFVDDTDDLLPG